MTPRQIEDFKKRLVDEMTALYRTVHSDVREGVQSAVYTEAEDPRDEVDDSQLTQQRDLQRSLAEAESYRAQLIEAALRRIRQGEFGRCIDCGAEIEVPRLRLVPWTPRCLECQESVEREARGRAPTL